MGKYWADPLGPAARPEKGPLRQAGKQTGTSLLSRFLSTVITVSKKVENPALEMEKSSLISTLWKEENPQSTPGEKSSGWTHDNVFPLGCQGKGST